MAVLPTLPASPLGGLVLRPVGGGGRQGGRRLGVPLPGLRLRELRRRRWLSLPLRGLRQSYLGQKLVPPLLRRGFLPGGGGRPAGQQCSQVPGWLGAPQELGDSPTPPSRAGIQLTRQQEAAARGPRPSPACGDSTFRGAPATPAPGWPPAEPGTSLQAATMVQNVILVFFRRRLSQRPAVEELERRNILKRE